RLGSGRASIPLSQVSIDDAEDLLAIACLLVSQLVAGSSQHVYLRVAELATDDTQVVTPIHGFIVVALNHDERQINRRRRRETRQPFLQRRDPASRQATRL